MSFQTALSGLNAANGNLNVTGHNIANASTVGFKRSRAEFADVYAVSFGGVAKTATGSGARMVNVAQQFQQGNVDYTDNNLDLAITGEGFFTVSDNGTTLYTRAGNFTMDREGYVVNSHGHRLQAYQTTATGFTANPGDLRLNTSANPARATDAMDLNIQLDAASDPADLSGFPVIAPLNPLDPTTYHFATTTTIYDSLGVKHEGTLFFRKETAGTNDWSVTLQTTDINGTTAIHDTEIVKFDTNGTLLTSGPMDFMNGIVEDTGLADPLSTGGFNPSTGATPMAGMTVNFNGSTQFGAETAVGSLVQYGYTTGRLSGLSVDATGVVFAKFTNGQSQALGQVALARFNNNNGLQQTGDTNWAETFESGEAFYGQAGAGTFGLIQSGALEASNVDISKQLVNMIIAQRDFQANAKMISTEDTITQTIINIR